MLELESHLEEIVRQFEELERRLSLPAASDDPQRRSVFATLGKQHRELKRIVDVWGEVRELKRKLEETRALVHDADPEIAALARSEIKGLESGMEDAEHRLQILLLPKDPNDEKNIIMEIRAGTGGEEAALFAANLFRAYARYAESQGWKLEILDQHVTGLGGFKEIVFSVEGNAVYSRMKFESGAHRVQRVPETETGGRIHTSAVTVAVLPEAEEVEVEVRPEDLRIDVYRSTGPGGQSVNTTDSAVRITHIPTGLVVTCQDEKSQLKNKVKALKVLRARLYDQELNRQQEAISSTRREQVGTGDRSERIRTYNFPQCRVTDHRIGLTLYKLDAVMEGDLEEIIKSLVREDQLRRLKSLGC
ncbi:MAG TPA: peptide chain release factor 1 [Candidatus Sumerlaeota bacterium]|nr:peptide chain release factor 1 [Candidatus Sumerlaeota bacterium]